MKKQSHSNEHFWTVLYNDDCGTYLRDETEMKLLTLLHVKDAETTKNVIIFARTRQAGGGVDKDKREVICIDIRYQLSLL